MRKRERIRAGDYPKNKFFGFTLHIFEKTNILVHTCLSIFVVVMYIIIFVFIFYKFYLSMNLVPINSTIMMILNIYLSIRTLQSRFQKLKFPMSLIFYEQISMLKAIENDYNYHSGIKL